MSLDSRQTPRAGAIILLLAGMLAAGGGRAVAQTSTERIEFAGFLAGDVVRDQFASRGVRLPVDPNGGPYYDDADVFAFLLDSPPGLLSLNPLAAFGGPGVVHGSIGTYVFDFVDPTNRFVGSETSNVSVAVAFPDRGDTVLEGWDASGARIAEASISLSSASFFPIHLQIDAPGIRRATLTTPQWNGTIGALIDTLTFTRPAVVPSRDVAIDIRPGSPRNTIRLGSGTAVRVALLSSPTFHPDQIDTGTILFQGAAAQTAMLVDRNRDRKRDWIFTFNVADLVGLTPASTEAVLTGLDADGTPIRGIDSITIQTGPLSPVSPFPGGDPSGGASLARSGSR